MNGRHQIDAPPVSPGSGSGADGKGRRKADTDAQELREQAEACRKAGQHDLARQLDAWATQLEFGGRKPKGPREAPLAEV